MHEELTDDPSPIDPVSGLVEAGRRGVAAVAGVTLEGPVADRFEVVVNFVSRGRADHSWRIVACQESPHWMDQP